MEEYFLYHPVIMIFSMAIIIIILAVGLAYFLEKTSCNSKTNIMGIEHSYGFFAGCMVKIDNKWQPFNDYNTVKINN